MDEDEMAAMVSDMELKAREALDPVIAGLSELEQAAALYEISGYLHYLSNEAVSVARANGATWAEVGEAFGITRQSAHERFSRLYGMGGS